MGIDWGSISAVLCCIAGLGTLAALGAVKWFRQTESVETGFVESDRLPGFVQRRLSGLQEAGFSLLGLRKETYSEMPYLHVSADSGPVNAEFTTGRESDLFLTVPNYGEEEFYFLTTFRDGLAVVTAVGPYRQTRDEDRFDFLRLVDQSVSQLLSEHRVRVQKREAEGHVRSGLTGRSGRDAACRILYSTPSFLARARGERVFLLGALAALWITVGGLVLIGYPPNWQVPALFWNYFFGGIPFLRIG
ncbi:MAG: hypothetical protein QM765_46320 [Myxococcales bacterium]